MYELRDCRRDDLQQIRDLNESAIPAVNRLSLDDLDWFRLHADCFRVAERAGEIGGFLIGLVEGVDYASENYRWFSRQFDRFAYVDRIVIGESARRHGLARRFYEEFAERSGRASMRLVCEVNLEPPNEGSMRFHERMGFRQIATQETEGGSKRVALLIRELEENHA